MSDALSLAAVIAVSVPLGCYATRRLILVAAAALPPRPLARGGPELPSLAILVAARNEAATIGRTLEALDAIEYPRDRLRVVLVDDGSTDGTGGLLVEWASGWSHASALTVAEPVGKAEALNRAIAQVPDVDLVGVCDADQQPHPDCFRRIAEAFADSSVGAAAGFLVPANAGVTPVAHYAAVEAWVHQLVTSAGKDRLDLNPPTLGGACAYRRSALAQVGGFRPGAHGEDVESTVSLTWAGWRTRFVPCALADNVVVYAWRDYWRQHIRWARSLFDTARREDRRTPTRSSPLARRIELLILSTGYADRLALLIAAGLAAGAVIPFWVPVAYLTSIVPGLLVALAKGKAGARAPVYLAWTAAFFVIDVVASVTAILAHLRGTPRVWLRPPRRPDARRATPEPSDSRAAARSASGRDLRR